MVPYGLLVRPQSNSHPPAIAHPFYPAIILLLNQPLQIYVRFSEQHHAPNEEQKEVLPNQPFPPSSSEHNSKR